MLIYAEAGLQGAGVVVVQDRRVWVWVMGVGVCSRSGVRAGQGGRAIVCPLVVEPLPQVVDLGLGVFRVLMSSRSVPIPMFHFDLSSQRRK